MTRRINGYKHKLKVFWPASPKDPASIATAADGMQQIASLARQLGATVITDRQDWGSITEPAPPHIGNLFALPKPADPPVPAEAAE